MTAQNKRAPRNPGAQLPTGKSQSTPVLIHGLLDIIAHASELGDPQWAVLMEDVDAAYIGDDFNRWPEMDRL